MRTGTANDRLRKAREALARVTRVVYVYLPASTGIADEHGEMPAQRDYYCIVDSAEGARCIATVTAVDTKVLCLIPHADSGMCARCEYIDAWADGQAEANALFQQLLMSPVEIVPMVRKDHAACGDPAPHICPECQHRPVSESERPMARPS